MRRCSLFVSSLIMSVTASAHHSFGAFYDMSELVELEGAIRDLDHDVLLEQGKDFIVGASEELAFNE